MNSVAQHETTDIRIAILRFPNAPHEADLVKAIQQVGMSPVVFAWNESLASLNAVDGYLLIGALPAGVIAATHPAMRIIADEAAKGKPVLGLGEAAAWLLEAGLVPGLENNKAAIALAPSQRRQEDKIQNLGVHEVQVHVRLSDDYQRNAYTRHLNRETIVPVMLGLTAGRFVLSEILWQEIEQQGLNVFQYCDESGAVIDDATVNPLGSMGNMAAIANKAGHVMALLPPLENTAVGEALLLSMRDYIKKAHYVPVLPLSYYPRRLKPLVYQPAPQAKTRVMRLQEDFALVVEQALNESGLAVRVRCQAHLEVQGVDEAGFAAIMGSGVLYDAAQAEAVSPLPSSSAAFLVRPKEDDLGKLQCLTLAADFGVTGVEAIHHGVIWYLFSDTPLDDAKIQACLDTRLFYHPLLQACYRYTV